MIRRDPAPVIAHPHQLDPPLLQLDADPHRPRIQRILHQLLHNRCRSLDDLAGSDLIGDLIGENLHPRARQQAHNPAISVVRTQP